MAKFTAGVDLNIRLPNGEELIGAAGTTHRFSDALVDEFVRDVVPHIPGFAWVVQDETSAISGGASTSVSAETAYGVSSSAGTAASFSRGDHTHGSPSLATTAASTLTIGNSASTGTATLPARADHAHGLPAFAAVTAATTYGISSADGTAATVARSDHTHGSVANPIISGSGFTVASGTFSAVAAAIVGSGLSVLAGNIALSAASQALVVPGLLRFGGSSFPASPTSGDQFWRSDLDLGFYYDGTRWLSTTLFSVESSPHMPVRTQPLTATTSPALRFLIPTHTGASDLWIASIASVFTVVTGGSALSGSHKWVCTTASSPAGTAALAITAADISSGSSAVWRMEEATIGALASGDYMISLTATKTGTPGDLYIGGRLLYRVVAT